MDGACVSPLLQDIASPIAQSDDVAAVDTEGFAADGNDLEPMSKSEDVPGPDTEGCATDGNGANAPAELHAGARTREADGLGTDGYDVKAPDVCASEGVQSHSGAADAEAAQEEAAALQHRCSSYFSALGEAPSQVEKTDTSTVYQTDGAAERSASGSVLEPLTAAQAEELIKEVELMRRKSSNTNKMLHGWQVTYTLRTKTASSTRGDMCVIDQRDGKKIFSLVALKRKLAANGVYEHVEELFESAAAQAEVEAEAAGLGEERKKRRRAAYELLREEAASIMEERSTRRARANVNYAEVSSSFGPSMADRVLGVVADEKEEKFSVCGAGHGDDPWPGVDVVAMSERLHSSMQKNENIPLGSVRAAVINLLRNGRLRRRLASSKQLDRGGVAGPLRLLVLNTLQVENDEAAPWSVPVSKSEPQDDTSRTHVWKGVTPHHLAELRGAQLVGRVVEVFWPGDSERSQRWHAAKITGYNATDRAMGYHDGTAGTHILLYGTGLRAIEQLEGAGEPLLWRLASQDVADDLEAWLDAEGLPTEEVAWDAESEEEREAKEKASAAFNDAVNVVFGSGAGDEDDADDDDYEPPVKVTLRCEGCMPVGTKGTAAHAARLAAKEAAKKKQEEGMAMVGKMIEVYWPDDREWYAAEILEFDEIDSNLPFYIEYTVDGEREYTNLDEEQWRYVDGQAPQAAGAAMDESIDMKVGAEEEAAGQQAQEVEANRTLTPQPGATEPKRDARSDASDMSVDDAASSCADMSVGEAKADATQVAGFNERDWRAEGPRIEAPMTIDKIKAALPISTKDVGDFAPPEGWSLQEVKPSGKRKLTIRWVREVNSVPGRPSATDTREGLEQLLELEAKADGKPWLGQLVEGQWEIRKKAVDDAIRAVLADLVGAGLVRAISGESIGKGTSAQFVVVNRYVKGEPFPVIRNKKVKEVVEEEVEELCDFELERKRNIARNQELLRQLGLL